MKNTYFNDPYLYYTFAECVSPVAEGVKPSGLLTIWKYRIPHIDLGSYLHNHQEFLVEGCSFEILKETSLYYLLFFYQEDMLKHTIREYRASELLKGYPVEELSKIIHYLKKRIMEYHFEGKEFPHEIGIFLGYPIWDVEGFIEHKGQNYKFCGYWKVYQDVEGAKLKFKEYDRIRESALHKYYCEVEKNNRINS
ncbi:MAG: DUF3793 family protein [Clostridium sp.]|nr:DUF3793 family protein [Clostridium sp.]